MTTYYVDVIYTVLPGMTVAVGLLALWRAGEAILRRCTRITRR